MSNRTILFNSITWAIRAQKLLEQRGIRSAIRKISKVGTTRGCGYGLDVRGDLQNALRLLSAADIRIVDVVDA